MYPQSHPYYYQRTGSSPMFHDSPAPEPAPFDLSIFPVPYHPQSHMHSHPQTPTGGFYQPPASYGTNLGLAEHSSNEFPRTVILRGLKSDLTVNEVLNFIDFGPIEYVVLKRQPQGTRGGLKPRSTKSNSGISRSSLSDEPPKEDDLSKTSVSPKGTEAQPIKPQQGLLGESETSTNLKIEKTEEPMDSSAQTPADAVCYIAFLNPQICANFYVKYKAKNNLRQLRDKLGSEYLKISLNESGRPDFIKFKTQNYILDHGATRCLEIEVKDDSNLQEKCAKFGEVELFQSFDCKKSSAECTKDANESGTEQIDPITTSSKFVIHFTSIDSAIRCFEHLPKSFDQSEIKIRFQNDRCDRNSLETIIPGGGMVPLSPASSHRSLSSVSVGVGGARRNSNSANVNYTMKPNTANSLETCCSNGQQHNSHQFLPDESIINIPEDDSLGSENSEVLSNYLLENDSFNSQQHPGSAYSGSYNHGQFYHQHHPSHMPGQHPLQPVLSHRSLSTVTSGHQPNSVYSPSLHTAEYMGIPQSPYMMGPPMMSYYPPPDNSAGNRTIYLGNIHPNTTVEEIANNVRAGGLVQQIKYFQEKRVCFITFIDPSIALKFYLNHQVLHQLVIHGCDITVGWAKQHSGPLNRDISLAVSAGASRNVYIGIKPPKDDSEPKLVLPSEEEMRSDFSKFGELEQINFYHNRDCGFLNFLNIADAIKLVDAFNMKNVDRINKIVGDNGEFYEKYNIFKINFAKDRCGNPPKFNIKKKPPRSSKSYREEDLYEVDIVNELREHSRLEEELRSSQDSSQDHINEEAAMVFGIISGTKCGDQPDNSESTEIGLGFVANEKEEKDDDKANTGNPETKSNDKNQSINSETTDINLEQKTTEKSSQKEKQLDKHQVKESEISKIKKEQTKEKEGKEKEQGKEKEHEKSNEEDDEEEDEEEEEEDDDDDEEEDEVSIIIDSENSEKPPLQKSETRQSSKSRSETYRKKEYPRKASNASINSGHSGYFYPPPSQNGFQGHSPYIHQQQMYYMPSHRGPSTPARMNGFGYPVPQAGAASPILTGAPYMGYPPPPPLLGQGSFKGIYSSSGSQVMAQYLAQAQHDNMMYANSVYNHEPLSEEEIYYRQRKRG